MSINITNKVEKSPRTKKTENDINMPHSRRYNVRREEDNQSNGWRGIFDRRSEEPPPEYRFKSYDYLPMKYLSDEARNGRRLEKDISHSPIYQKYQRSSQPNFSRRFSSSEDLDYSHNFDCSSENSRRQFCKTSNQSYGDCINKSPQRYCEEYKHISGPKDYQNIDTYNVRSFHNSSTEKPKRASFSRNYIDNNRSNIMKQNSFNLQSDDYKDLRRFEDNNNKGAKHLRSKYRNEENISYSRSKPENHRKEMDCKYYNRNHYNDFHNSGRGLQYKLSLIKRNKGALLPPSPKYSNLRKSCSLEKHSFDKNSYKHSPQRYKGYYNEGISDEDSCCFENCRNSNNDYLSKPQLDDTKASSISRSDSGSSNVLFSNEKPTESIPISVSTPKIDSNIKLINQIPKTNSNCLLQKHNKKELSSKHRHICRSSRHRSAHRH